MMNPDAMIDMLLTVPYKLGSGDFTGMDCWGLVELWYAHGLDIELTDRGDHPSGRRGLQAGFKAARDWQIIDSPKDHCLVLMRSGELKAGHVGVFFDGHVVHTDVSHGCVYQPIDHPTIKSRITHLLERSSGAQPALTSFASPTLRSSGCDADGRSRP